MAHWGDFQYELYLAGLSGHRPELPMTAPELEEAARAVLGPEAYGYVAGSAGLETTATGNREAFARWQLVPRHLRGVAERDLSTEVCGTAMPAPVALAPVGVLGITHPDAELAVARAAAGLGIPMTLSTLSSYSLEEVASALEGSPGWYQLYWPRHRGVAASFVERAERAGFRALVLTVDTWSLAWRPRDLAHGFLPFLSGLGMGTYFSDPVFRSLLDRPPEDDRDAAVAAWAGMFGHPSLVWEDLAWLRDQTSLPILLKGICHRDDAAAAVDAGVDGLVVSNHGGRQVDGARPALDCLPEVVAAAGALPVLFDSGIRCGADVAKAIALGARAVLVGRPFVWGLALAGEAGVRHVLRCLLAELDLTLALSGHRDLASLGPGSLVPSG